MARWSSLYRYGSKGRGMQAVARRASATIPAMRLEQAVRAVPSNMNPELGYAERDRVISKISLAATLHQADQATISYLGHFSKTLVESLGEDAKPVLPIFQELLAVKELRSRYLERRRSLLEQKQAAESSTLHLKAAIADLEGLEEASSQEQPPEEGKMPQTLAKNILGLDHPTPPSVPPSYNGPSVVGGLVGLKQRMKMRYESQVYALQEESFRAHALLREIDGDGPSRAVEAVVAAKEATLLKELAAVLDKCKRSSLQLMYEQRADADNLDALA